MTLKEFRQALTEAVRLHFDCDRSDEFGFAGPCERFHAQLEERGIEHSFRIYSEPKAERISPHMLGIAWHVLPALHFCLDPTSG